MLSTKILLTQVPRVPAHRGFCSFAKSYVTRSIQTLDNQRPEVHMVKTSSAVEPLFFEELRDSLGPRFVESEQAWLKPYLDALTQNPKIHRDSDAILVRVSEFHSLLFQKPISESHRTQKTAFLDLRLAALSLQIHQGFEDQKDFLSPKLRALDSGIGWLAVSTVFLMFLVVATGK